MFFHRRAFSIVLVAAGVLGIASILLPHALPIRRNVTPSARMEEPASQSVPLDTIEQQIPIPADHSAMIKMVLPNFAFLGSDTARTAIEDDIASLTQSFREPFVREVTSIDPACCLRNLVDNFLEITATPHLVPAEQPQVLSVRFDIIINAGNPAHASNRVLTRNYALASGEPIMLESLFVPDASYLKRLSQYVIGELVVTYPDYRKAMIYGAGPVAENFTSFEIRESGLAVDFESGQVGPHGFAPVVVVPYSELQDILDPNGPIGWLQASSPR